ncbi:MAG: carboxylesterase family protein [Protaetiibacter sp.]
MQATHVRRTSGGLIRGIGHNGVERYLGIRYGVPPSGALRWREPEPASWSGTADAFAYSPIAPQLDTRLSSGGIMPAVLDLLYPRGGSPAENGTMGEDCLSLNVWAPEGAEGLPVLVWLHGGGFAHGAGSEQVFAGDRLARTGRVVVVSVNHRLGLTGFLALDHLLGDEWRGSANAGVADLLLALRWVADNVAAFGGDPSRVTIAGQSGGAAKVATLTAMPDARGLFHGAIMQSGPARWIGDLEWARAQTAAVLELAHIPVPDAELLLELPLRQLLDLQRAADASGGISWRPAVDGGLIAGRPFEGSTMPAVPMLVGYTSHDVSLFLCERDDYRLLDLAAVTAVLSGSHGGDAGRVLEAEAAAHPGEPPQLLLARVLTRETMARSAHLVLQAVSGHGTTAYGYRFDYATEAMGGLLGATHSSDLAFVFGTVDSIPLSGQRPARFMVSDAVRDAWIAFAESGAPGHAGLPDWPAYTAAAPSLLAFDEVSRLEEEPCDLGVPARAPAFWPETES